jgi:hypothetical protein
MLISGFDDDIKLDIQEGGISINECIELMKSDKTIPDDVLRECNYNPNDPNKQSTKCRVNRGTIDYKLAKEVFEKYYNETNLTDSGKLRGMMFDMKYNKKNKNLLYPGEKCSQKYLEPDGPRKYDMWLVDAFPEGETIKVNDDLYINTQNYYDENIPSNLKYGPMITYGLLLHKNYNVIYKLVAKEELDEDEAKQIALKEAMKQTDEQIKSSADIRLFNQYFSKVSVPTWLNDYKHNLVREGKQAMDINSKEFKKSIEDAIRRKDKIKENRKLKKKRETSPELELPKELLRKKQQKIDTEPVLKKKQVPDIELSLPAPVQQHNDYNVVEIFKQPNQTKTKEGLIHNLDEYRKLILVNITETINLYNNETKYLYNLPFNESFINSNDYELLENVFNDHIEYFFETLIKPITPFAMLTFNGIKEL